MIGAMLADSTNFKTVSDFINDPNWVFEQKADGNRILLTVESGSATAITRNGTIYSKKLPKSMRDFQFPQRLVLDGELVGDDFWVFDMPVLDDGPTLLNLDNRRKQLETLFRTGWPSLSDFKLIPQARTPEDKQMMLDLAIARGWEGLMVKRLNSSYSPGRSRAWLKAKQTQTADVVVIEVGRYGKEAATLGAIDPVLKRAVEVGRCSLIGKPKVKPMDVVEVKYLYLGANQRLYQPTLLRVRDDKKPIECLTTQFRHVNKAMLATLSK